MKNKKSVNEMSVFEVARWLSLVEAINIIADEAEQRKVDFNKLKISPLDVESYIEKTCDIYARKLEQENQNAVIIDMTQRMENDIYSRV